MKTFASALLLFALITPAQAHATTAEALSMSDLVERSARIAVVEVIAKHVRYDRFGRIVTDYTLFVEEALMGVRDNETFNLVSLGGIIGEIGMRIEGEPHFQEGDHVLLFARHVNGIYRSVGMSQGTLMVEGDTTPTVQPGGAGLSLTGHSASGQQTPGLPALRGPRPLQSVLAHIRTLIEARADRLEP